MVEQRNITLSACKYITGETDNVCRLCFGSADEGASLDDCREMQTSYCNDIVSFREMFLDLGITIDPALPNMLCVCCSDLAINAYLFLKLCHNSNDEWLKVLDQLNKTLELSKSLSPNVKTTYFVLKNDQSLLLKSRLYQKKKSKKAALKKVKELMTSYCQKITNKQKSCKECGKKFPSKVILLKHMRVHGDRKYSCTSCLKVFPTNSQLQVHIERIHKPKVIPCPLCNKMFSTSNMLKYHNSNHHQPVLCMCCSETFPSKNILRQHLNESNIKECPRCHKVLRNKYTYKLHIKICGNDKEKQLKYFCDICMKGYIRKNGIKSHLTTDHGFGRVYTCDWCSKPFDAPSKLKNHIVKHTRERRFFCHECGSKFVTEAALIYHVRLHTGEKPFPCDMCDERFLSASRRMEHKRRKHLGRNRQCPYCQSTFVTNHELKTHVARHQNPQSRLFISKKSSGADSSTPWEQSSVLVTND